MIRAGADVYAENDDGETPTKRASPYNCHTPMTECWGMALTKCGFNVGEVFERSGLSYEPESSSEESVSEETTPIN
jgi:hypothetical protein